MSSQINTKINDALKSIDVLWCPVMYAIDRAKPNDIIIEGYTNNGIFPCCLQAIEDVTRYLDNGQIEKVISFYLFDKISEVEPDIVEEIMPLYDNLERTVEAFRDALQLTTDYCEITGDMTRSHHTMAIVEAGISFQLTIREMCYD